MKPIPQCTGYFEKSGTELSKKEFEQELCRGLSGLMIQFSRMGMIDKKLHVKFRTCHNKKSFESGRRG